MKIKISIAAVGSGMTAEDTMDLFCGTGEQILQWIGYAACSRLAYKRGEVYGRYVPQSVMTKDGQPLDVDIVLNEIFHDGDELFVEYSSGPVAYKVRWDGRPKTPPFKWGEDGEVLPPHDIWLTELDLKHEGLGALLEPDLVRQDPGIVDKDLERVKQTLVTYAGALQMLFLYHSSEGIQTSDQLCRMTLPQFRTLMQATKVITSKFSAEKVDEIFTTVATSDTTLARKVENKSGVSTFHLLDFMIALVHIAYHRFGSESPQTSTYTHLSVKFNTVIRDCLCTYLFPELSKKLSKFAAAYTPGTQLLLKKGRRLTEQTLDTCQLKRVKSSAVRVDLRYICNHLQRWTLLGREFSFQELALIAIFAKQPSADPEKFVLHPEPLEYDYDEFEKLLLGMSFQMFMVKKKMDDANFNEFLGETLDTVFKKAGVLVEINKDKDMED